MKPEAINSTIDEFETSNPVDLALKEDVLDLLRAATAEVALNNKGVFAYRLAELSAKYSNRPDVVGYLKAVALKFLTDLEVSAKEALSRVCVEAR